MRWLPRVEVRIYINTCSINAYSDWCYRERGKEKGKNKKTEKQERRAYASSWKFAKMQNLS